MLLSVLLILRASVGMAMNEVHVHPVFLELEMTFFLLFGGGAIVVVRQPVLGVVRAFEAFPG